MDEPAKKFRPGMEYKVSLDTMALVNKVIREIVETLLEAIALVVLVVFVFLHGWRATLITVPVSLVGAILPLLGFSVNTLSLLGLVPAIGLVVDDAIVVVVVVEAVEHHIERGVGPHLGVQRAHAEPGARGAAPQAARLVEGALRAARSRLQPGLRAHHRRLHLDQPPPGAEAVHHARVAREAREWAFCTHPGGAGLRGGAARHPQHQEDSA